MIIVLRRPFLRLVTTLVGAIPLPVAATASGGPRDSEPVGWHGPARLVTPVNQVVTPTGRHLLLPGLRPQGLALSPDGTLLVVSGKTSEILVLDPASGGVLQRVALPSEKLNESQPEAASANLLEPDTKGQLSYTGLVFAPGGRRLYLSNVNGSIKVFAVGRDGRVEPSHSIPLPPADAPRRREEIPSGLAVSADGTRLYVCGNLSNRLLEIATATGAVHRTWDVGVAPCDVVLVGDKAYVSNWGGRRPQAGDLTGPAGRGTVVKVDSVRHIASEGSVTVIHLADRQITGVLTGLHASALAVAPDGRHVVCANAAADTLSVIDTRTDTVVETIWTKQSPADLFGASPNALAFAPDGQTLYVANGTQNAVAFIRFSPQNKSSKLQGLIPVGWFPGALVLDAARRTLLVANVKGHAAAPQPSRDTGRPGFNSRQSAGSLSLVSVPAAADLPKLSAVVYDNYRRERLAEALRPPRPGQPPRPVPERIGEPSTIRHVVYVIKENRTYDQVLGDLPQGNGDPSLCIFGERVTPNQHRLVRDFVLLDNTYCCGILSADGHQWSTTAFATDYVEKSFANWPRSYPDGMGPDEFDALAYAPSGFIWDNALKHGISLWNFGEFAEPKTGWKDPQRKGKPAWLDFWREFQTGAGEVTIGSEPGLPALRPFTPTGYVGWQMDVPDVWRARFIVNQIVEWDRTGQMPRLVLICLPNDHTSGTKAGCPTPAATVADNDLAFGRIVEALSRTRFWRELAIFGIEDDPQNGWDHVSGYRTTAYVVSPWAKRGAVVSTQYNTTSLLRTIEQILGLPPMNQFDATATPMADCFTDRPDFTPYTALPANIPLDEMNPGPKAIRDPLLREQALASARLDFSRVDACPEGVLNRILWHAAKGPAAPFPAWAVAGDD
jgi:YVTN family beta-propeller protein